MPRPRQDPLMLVAWDHAAMCRSLVRVQEWYRLAFGDVRPAGEAPQIDGDVASLALAYGRVRLRKPWSRECFQFTGAKVLTAGGARHPGMEDVATSVLKGKGRSIGASEVAIAPVAEDVHDWLEGPSELGEAVIVARRAILVLDALYQADFLEFAESSSEYVAGCTGVANDLIEPGAAEHELSDRQQ